MLTLLLLCSCGNTLYHDFCNVDDGWCCDDTLTFTVTTPFMSAESCNAYVELRSTPDYPYRKLWLCTSVRHSIDNSTFLDTLCCEIYDSLGQHNGSTAGLFYQTRHRLGRVELAADDTVTVAVTHLMDEGVVGVRSVGIRFERCGRHLPSGN